MTGERGSITVSLAVALVLGLLLAVGVAAVGQIVFARVRVTTAADAAALAAAPLTFRPFGTDWTPGAEAARFASLNGAVLTECRCLVDRTYETRIVEVTVQIRVDILGVREVVLAAVGAAEFRPMLLLFPNDEPS